MQAMCLPAPTKKIDRSMGGLKAFGSAISKSKEEKDYQIFKSLAMHPSLSLRDHHLTKTWACHKYHPDPSLPLQ